MRILELEIINFGKFNHETVTFHDGMNLIYGENEMGKQRFIHLSAVCFRD